MTVKCPVSNEGVDEKQVFSAKLQQCQTYNNIKRSTYLLFKCKKYINVGYVVEFLIQGMDYKQTLILLPKMSTLKNFSVSNRVEFSKQESMAQIALIEIISKVPTSQ